MKRRGSLKHEGNGKAALGNGDSPPRRPRVLAEHSDAARIERWLDNFTWAREEYQRQVLDLGDGGYYTGGDNVDAE